MEQKNLMDAQMQTPIEQMSYEEAFSQLEEIVAALESNQNNLDQSVSLYERGQALVRRCAQLLDKAELRVSQLTENGLEDFSGEA
jgi:exodeoxyribonuclease VII small subunit